MGQANYKESTRHTLQRHPLVYCDEIADSFGAKPKIWDHPKLALRWVLLSHKHEAGHDVYLLLHMFIFINFSHCLIPWRRKVFARGQLPCRTCMKQLYLKLADIYTPSLLCIGCHLS